MPITGNTYPFTVVNIKTFAPTRPGVYALYQDQVLTYYGRSSDSIRDRLLSHKGGHEGSCTQVASHFNWEETTRPVERERALLQEFQRTYGRLPRCNDRVG